MSKATEVMMQYVENLKRTYEKDHAELMEFKKLANQNSNRCYGGSVDTGGKITEEMYSDQTCIFHHQIIFGDCGKCMRVLIIYTEVLRLQM